MNIVIPAEASLDTYKAAYVIFRKRQMKLCNLVFAYPTRSFVIADRDVIINVHIDVSSDRNITYYRGYSEVMAAFGNPVNMRFLEHIPDSMILCFRNDDRTLLAAALFEAFDAFEVNLREATSVHELLASREIKKAGDYTVVIGRGENYLSPEERIVLFKNRRAQYVVFETGGSFGVQKCISQQLPSLAVFAKDHLGDDSRNFFIHRRGHVLVSKTSCTPATSLNDLVSKLMAYLTQNR